MNRRASFTKVLVSTALMATALMATFAVGLARVGSAQSPQADPPARGPGGPPPDPLRAALDADGDHELSPDEVKNAATAVAKLDRNGDGRIDHEELRPPWPPRRGPPDGEGVQGRRPPLRERPDGGPARGGPAPEWFVERAMAFDADGDGKLDRAELERFAAERQERFRGGGGDSPVRPRRPE